MILQIAVGKGINSSDRVESGLERGLVLRYSRNVSASNGTHFGR